MTIRKHSNNFGAILNGSIDDTQTTLTVSSATGLPTIGAGEEFSLTLYDGALFEIVRVTDDSSSPVLTIVRGAEGSTAQAWADMATIQLRDTADSYDRKEDLISGRTLTTATVATNDKILIQDTSGSDVLKTVTAQSIADLATGGVTDGDKGDITVSSTGTVWTIDNDVVTYAKIQNISATDKLLGRSSSGAGDTEEITCTAAGRALIDDAAASDQRTTLGLGTLATQSGTFSGTSSGTNTGDQNLFSTISISGQSDIVADSTTDTLTIVAGSNITLTTNASTDTLTIAASGGGGGAITQIDDINGNEQMVFIPTTSAVNYMTVTNSATGNGPILGTDGSNTDVDLNIEPKGLGKVVIKGIQIWKGASDSSGNIAIGGSTLIDSTSAGTCTIVGYQAGFKITSASNSTALGYQSLLNATTSQGSTAIGYQSCTLTGSNNTGVGWHSINGTGAGSENTAVGTSALDGITSGAGNELMGYSAGQQISTGGDNVGIGYDCFGSSATGDAALMTGNFNTALGNFAGVSASDTEGALALGAYAVATKATGATSSDDGPGISIGSAEKPVGFRGDATIYPTAGAVPSGFLKIKINGVFYKIQLMPLS